MGKGERVLLSLHLFFIVVMAREIFGSDYE
jgi:hypothetical protein